MGLLSGFGESFLDEWCGRGRLLWDNAMFAEYIIPVNNEVTSCQFFDSYIQLLTTRYRH